MAGALDVPVRTFALWQVVGGVIWAAGVTLAGYGLGSTIPSIDTYLLPIIAVIIIVSLIPIGLELLRTRRATRSADPGRGEDGPVGSTARAPAHGQAGVTAGPARPLRGVTDRPVPFGRTMDCAQPGRPRRAQARVSERYGPLRGSGGRQAEAGQARSRTGDLHRDSLARLPGRPVQAHPLEQGQQAPDDLPLDPVGKVAERAGHAEGGRVAGERAWRWRTLRPGR